MHDYLVVGAGFSGATFAYFAARAGKRVLVVDRRPHLAGNAFTSRTDGIDVHQYGAHIFHTNDRTVWEFVTSFSPFLPYSHRVKVRHGDRTYSFPINLMTLHQVFGVNTPAEATLTLAAERRPIVNPANLEEYALSQVGERLYRLFICGYTKKQWGREPRELPVSILKRVPVRLTFDDAYFSDRYQGIPVDGYTAIVERMLDGIPVELGVDFHGAASQLKARKVVYTGPIDRYFDYVYGRLDYRSLRFDHRKLALTDFQGAPVINYSDDAIPFTRIVEHKHFTGARTDSTVITHEYPADFRETGDPYYPINDERNMAIYRRYREVAEQTDNVIFLGRLGRYTYFDMHQVIAAAMAAAEAELGTASVVDRGSCRATGSAL